MIEPNLTGNYRMNTMNPINTICSFADFGADPMYFSKQPGVIEP